MSREIRRVPIDFDWPLKRVWDGYLMPDKFQEDKCPDCKNGYSPYAEELHSRWYGYVPFDPTSTGSAWLTPASPAVREFAERNVSRSPDYYGSGEAAIVREARRLADLWNEQWSHHLAQVDVDALVEAGRLHDFTHTWVKGDGWVEKSPPYRPTAAEVNEWSLRGMGHDSINCWVVIEAACKRADEPRTCATCGGHSTIEKYPGQRAEGEAWSEEDHDPPTGDGWQVWETTSEGSPISPVFEDRESLVEFLTSDKYYGFGTSPTPLTREQAEAFVGLGSSMGSFVMSGGQMINGDAAVHELDVSK